MLHFYITCGAIVQPEIRNFTNHLEPEKCGDVANAIREHETIESLPVCLFAWALDLGLGLSERGPGQKSWPRLLQHRRIQPLP